MLIGIDGNEANIKQRVGVNVWAFEILKGMYKKVPARRCYASGVAGGQEGTRKYKKVKIIVYLSRSPMEDLPEESENWKYRVIGPGKFWTRWRLPLDLYFHKPRPDVFLSLSHYTPKWSPVPRVICIMDLSFLKYPEAFKPAVLWQLVNWTRESVRNADHVITISEFNKKEIVREYKYPEEKIAVVYPGVSEIFRIFKGRTLGTQGPTLRDLRDLRDKKYLLFVGTRQPKKNLSRLIQAFELVRKKFPDVELVIAGKIWKQFTDEKFAKPSQVKYLGYVPEEDLPGLYAGAEALVLPSLYEGFGIPAVEAMSIGTLVVASNATSLPEVAAGAGILFNPLDVKDMADKISLALSIDKNRKRELIKKGMIRAEGFSWDVAAGRIIRILQLFK